MSATVRHVKKISSRRKAVASISTNHDTDHTDKKKLGAPPPPLKSPERIQPLRKVASADELLRPAALALQEQQLVQLSNLAQLKLGIKKEKMKRTKGAMRFFSRRIKPRENEAKDVLQVKNIWLKKSRTGINICDLLFRNLIFINYQSLN